jgi:hypothetical protein
VKEIYGMGESINIIEMFYSFFFACVMAVNLDSFFVVRACLRLSFSSSHAFPLQITGFFCDDHFERPLNIIKHLKYATILHK